MFWAGLFAGLPACAADEASFDTELVGNIEYGLVCDPGTIGTQDAPDTTIGNIGIIGNTPAFTWHGTIVPVAKGVSFGVEVIGKGEFLEPVDVIVTHPTFIGYGTKRERYSTSLSPESYTTDLFTFDYPHEMVPGRWVFEMQYQGRVLYHVAFQVVPPKTVPYLANLCIPGGLSS